VDVFHSHELTIIWINCQVPSTRSCFWLLAGQGAPRLQAENCVCDSLWFAWVQWFHSD